MQEDVLRLHVAMDHAVSVRVLQSVRRGHRDVHRIVDRELPLARQPRTQRLAVDVGHDVEQEPPVRIARLAGVEQREDVRVLEIRRDANLGEEPIRTELRAELRIEHLERDPAVVAQVAREIYRRHPPAPISRSIS